MENNLQTHRDAESVQDARASHRRRLLKPATLSPDGKDTTFDCVLRDLSPTGARLRVVCQTDIPNAFQLMSTEFSLCTNASVVWRQGNEMGVVFR